MKYWLKCLLACALLVEKSAFFETVWADTIHFFLGEADEKNMKNTYIQKKNKRPPNILVNLLLKENVSRKMHDDISKKINKKIYIILNK